MHHLLGVLVPRARGSEGSPPGSPARSWGSSSVMNSKNPSVDARFFAKNEMRFNVACFPLRIAMKIVPLVEVRALEEVHLRFYPYYSSFFTALVDPLDS